MLKNTKRKKNIETIEERIRGIEEWTDEEKQIALTNAQALKKELKDYQTKTKEEKEAPFSTV